MVQTMQYTVEVPQFVSGLSFLGRVHRYTARVAPAIRAGRGGGDAGSLLPGVLHPIRCIARTCQDRLAVSLII